MSKDLLELYQGKHSKRYKDVERNHELMEGFIRAVNIMTMVDNVKNLNEFSYLHYEQLKHQWSGYSSIRLSNKYVHRLIFKDTAD